MTDNEIDVTDLRADTLHIDLDSLAYDKLEISGAVPVEELEALADGYERRVRANKRKASELHTGIAIGRKRAAKELRELIQDYD